MFDFSAFDFAALEFPVFGAPTRKGHYADIVRRGGLQVIHADGVLTLRPREEFRREIEPRHLVIGCRDESHSFFWNRHYRRFADSPVVETWLEIRHEEADAVQLLRADSFAAELELAAPVRVRSLAGEWAEDAHESVGEVARGQSVKLASYSGTRSAWESNAAMLVECGGDVGEESGAALAVALLWSGTTEREIAHAWDGSRTGIFAGVGLESGPYRLAPGVVFRTPRAALVASDRGRGGVSRALHRWARNHLLPHGGELREILLNSWEGAYFDFDETVLQEMMDGLVAMGGELFVMDDGWFGEGEFARDEKNRDRAGLGDWTVNPRRLPRGLAALADAAAARELKFGLWVEPEMVNERSRLFSEHPEWLLRERDRAPIWGRGGAQAALDLANPALREHLFQMLSRLFASCPRLRYVKWDCNDHLVNPGSEFLAADAQGNLWVDYVLGLYELLARLRAAFPQIVFQACASGGGRMDFGMLAFADEFWTSDDTDPLRRVFLQYSASLFYPACAMAAHVTESPNHWTKRATPLKYRFDVAMSGRLGLELRPARLSAAELAYARERVEEYQRLRPWIQRGDLFRFASPYRDGYAAFAYASEDRRGAVLFLIGLDRDGELTIDFAVPEELRPLFGAARYRATLSGAYASQVLPLGTAARGQTENF